MSDTPVDVLLPRLRELGVAPVVEGPDGVVRVARRDAHRAGPRGTARPAGSPSRSPAQAARTAATVTAIRAGDRAAAVRPAPSSAPARQSPASALAPLREAIEAGSTVWIGYVDNDGSTHERVVDPKRRRRRLAAGVRPPLRGGPVLRRAPDLLRPRPLTPPWVEPSLARGRAGSSCWAAGVVPSLHDRTRDRRRLHRARAGRLAGDPLAASRRTSAAGRSPRPAGSPPTSAALCDERDHHASVDLRYPDLVHVMSTTHFMNGLTDRDVDAGAGDQRDGGRARLPQHPAGQHGRSRSRSTPWTSTRCGRSGRRSSATCPSTPRRASRSLAIIDPEGIGPSVLVPADGRAADRAQPDPPRRRRARTTSPSSGSRRPSPPAAAGQRREGEGVLGARRRRGQRGVHLHLAGPGTEVAEP